MTAEDALKTGTTTIGIKLKDGVILASDQRATMGNLIAHSHVQKVYQLSDNIGMTIAGVVGDAQLMVRFMQSEISIYSMKKGAPMSVTAAATLVASVIRQGFYLGLIVGGYDRTGGHVFSIDGAGGYIEDNYMSVGSGSVFALGSLEGNFKEGMSKDEGINVAIAASTPPGGGTTAPATACWSPTSGPRATRRSPSKRSSQDARPWASRSRTEVRFTKPLPNALHSKPDLIQN